ARASPGSGRCFCGTSQRRPAAGCSTVGRLASGAAFPDLHPASCWHYRSVTVRELHDAATHARNNNSGQEEENIVSNVVDLLERIGQSARLQALSGEQLAQELARAGIEPAVQAAIVQQRSRELEQLIGASSNVCCLVHAPQDEDRKSVGREG